MGLADLALKRAYHKPQDDIAGQFYLPAIEQARAYDRAVGFFSSSIYLLAWPSLKAFVANGGRMRLICSPVLADDDYDAMRDGYDDRADAIAGEAIRAAFAEMLASPALAKPAKVLASLVAVGVIDCKLAWVGADAGGRPKRLFHDKIGILQDRRGDRVAFKGSMNETWPGLALDGNLESVDVFASWRDAGEEERVSDEAAYFEDLWADRWPGVTVRPLPESARETIVSAADAGRWPELVDEICLDLDIAARWSAEADKPGGRRPLEHQVTALEAWTARGRRGIFEHATGSGKTFTALCAIADAFKRHEVPLVLAPSELLLTQWEGELRGAFTAQGLQLLVCGGGSAAWRDNGLLRSFTRPSGAGQRPHAVLSTLQTASTARFQALCAGGEHLFLVADEVHRLGATEARSVLTIPTGPRLGLSATPRRAGDPEGTAAILAYFEGVVPPPFTLQDAIKAGTLTPYAYHPSTVELSHDEQAAWDETSADIARLYARAKGEVDTPGSPTYARFRQLLIKRARIAKSARAKTPKAVEILRVAYAPGQRWIVYCDDQQQLAAVKAALRDADIPNVHEYHSNMAGDRLRTLEVFDRRGGVMVSIRCLDEGVDIPSVSHALVLASSRNPREFIQRRGRVLRRFPGKALAHVHDVIVTPAESDDAPTSTSLLLGELARAIEFGRGAINPAAVTDLKRIAARYDIDWSVLEGGFEDDEADASGADLETKECAHV
jgi:superfamily II DNA or RNA helicase